MYAEELQQLEDRGKKLAQQIISEAINKDVEKMPSGYLPESSQISVHISGGSNFFYDLDRNIRYPFSMYSHGRINIPSFKLSKESESEIFHLQKDYNFLSQKKRESKQEIKAVIYSVNTLNQLKNVWPKAVEFSEIQDEVKPKTELAPIVSKYNRLLK